MIVWITTGGGCGGSERVRGVYSKRQSEYDEEFEVPRIGKVYVRADGSCCWGVHGVCNTEGEARSIEPYRGLDTIEEWEVDGSMIARHYDRGY